MRWGVLLLLGLFFVSFASAVIPGDCEGSMIGYWKMDGYATDSYGSYDGSGGVFDNYVLKVGTAAKFLGSDKITVSNLPSSYFEHAFTIEMWIKKDYTESDGILFNKGNYQIEYISDGFKQGHIVASAGGSSMSFGNIGVDAYHVAVVWDSSGAKLKLYVNGVKVNETAMVSLVDVGASAAGNLIIGDGFTGLIDELAIYANVGSIYGALSAETIASHYLASSVGDDYCSIGSSTKATITIKGCNFEDDRDLVDGDTFGVAKGECSVSPYEGEFYCSEEQEKFVTNEWGLGCARGDSDFGAGDVPCCPLGSYCNASEDGKSFQCARSTGDCVDQGDSDDCVAIAGCVWSGDTCVYSGGDKDCGYYDNNDSCIEDEWDLGKTSSVTEICGTSFECNGETFTVPEDLCVCEWYEDSDIGQKCQNKFVAKSRYYDTDNPEEQNVFEWSNAYELGNCTDGEQDVTWDSTLDAVSGPILLMPDFAAVYYACCEEIGCNGGEGTRFCGEPIIKLPGFSLFAFFASLFIVGIYYIKKSETS